MAEVKCPECGNTVEEAADICPECGFPLDEYRKEKEEQKRRAEELRIKKEEERRRFEEERKRKQEEYRLKYEASLSNKGKSSLRWRILSVVSFILSGIMLYKVYDKMTRYYNPEYSWRSSVNAYVGADAYNYIINGTYATSFFILATMFALMGIGFIIILYLENERRG